MKTGIRIVLLWIVALVMHAQQRDVVLWYAQPAKNWNEALPIGNGRLGAMVYGGFGRETIQLNEESLWGGYKNDANAPAAEHLPEIKQLLLEGKIDEASALSEKYMRSNPLRIRSYQSFGNLYIDFFGELARSVKAGVEFGDRCRVGLLSDRGCDLSARTVLLCGCGYADVAVDGR